MKKYMLFALLWMGCTSAPEPRPDPVLVEVEPEAPKTVEVLVPVPYAQPMPGQAKYQRTGPTKREVEEARKVHKALGEVGAIEQAKARARQGLSAPEGYVNSTRVFDYSEGFLYPIRSAPMHLTDIVWSPGEQPRYIMLGDDKNWSFREIESGEGKSHRWHLVIMPHRVVSGGRGVHTTLLVTTNLGTYQFELKAVQHKGHIAQVSFHHPARRLEAYKTAVAERTKASKSVSKKDTSQGLAVNLERIENRYHLIRYGRLPKWRPTSVFHDGKRTYIQMPPESPRPAVFALLADKTAKIVQFHIKGDYIVVPGVLERAELRLGDASSTERVGFELAKEARR